MRYAVLWSLVAVLALGCEKKQLPEAEALANCARDAQATVDAFNRSDWATVARYTHVKVVKMMGGAEELGKKVSSELEAIKSPGIRFISASIDQPTQTYTNQGSRYAIVTQHIKLGTDRGDVNTNSSLIGYSSDGGSTWVFADASGLKDTRLKEHVFPDWPDDMPNPY